MTHVQLGDPLPSWNDTRARDDILAFVEAATALPPEERVAVFDNDGTLWCEKPMPIELAFIMQRLAEMAEEEPSLRKRQPWQAASTRDFGWLGDAMVRHYHGDDSGVQELLAAMLQAFAGATVEAYCAGRGPLPSGRTAPHAGPRAPCLRLPAHDRADPPPGGERVHRVHRLGW